MIRNLAFAGAALVVSLSAGSAARAAIFTVQPPFLIQDAVNAALSSGDLDDQINVKSGTYNELVTIDYTGSPEHSLTIIGVDSPRPVIALGVVIKNAHSVELKNFKVKSPLSDGLPAIGIDVSRRIIIDQCFGQLGDDFGVAATDSFEVTVSNSNFSGMVEDSGSNLGGYGISISGGCSHIVKNCTTETNEHDGISIVADRSKVVSCTSTGNHENGMSVIGEVDLVKDCTCEDNETNGILASGVVEIRSNTFSSNTKAGVKLGLSAGTTFTGGSIESNTIENNNQFGIALQADQDGCDVKSNTLSANRDVGIKVVSSHHRIHDNSVQLTSTGPNGGHGVLLELTADNNCVDGNTFKNNSGQGIEVAGDRNYILKNIGKGNDGFEKVSGADDNDGRDNTVETGTNDFA